MAGDLERLVRDLRRFDADKVITTKVREKIRKPVPAVRKAIKKRAVEILPKAGGLGAWVAGSRITARVTLRGRAAGVYLVIGRNSAGGRSDISAIDRGRVRHPSWGRRYRGQWFNQLVEPKFASGPATEIDQWRDAVLEAVDEALGVLRRG